MKHTLNNQNTSIEIYNTFFEYNPDATYAIQPNGEFILFNDAACELTGYTREEAIGMSFSTVIDPEHLEKTRSHFKEALSGSMESFQSALLTKSGDSVPVTIRIVPIMMDDQIKGIIGVTKDITDQVQLETLMHGQNRILEMITKNHPFQQVCEEITLLFEKISDSGGKCSIMLMDESRTMLVPVSSPSLPEEFINILNRGTVGENIGSCGKAAFSKTITIVEDTQNDVLWEKYKDIALRFNLMACWSIPIFDDHDNVLGTFAVYYDKCHRPDERDYQILKEACNLSGLAIQSYQTREKINHMAFHDPLTALPNRRLFDEKVSEALDLSKQSMTPFSVLFLDLDRFKYLNDTYGHNVGDLVLIEVAKRLKETLKCNDIVARQGGDEFTILLKNTSVETAYKVADQIVQVIRKPINIQGIELYVSTSVGISVYPTHGKNLSELLKKADAAMYQAKHDGGDQFKFHDSSIEEKNKQRLNIENQLRKALKKNEFTLHYQPKIDLSTQKIIGVEALIRWVNPKLGFVAPDKFIPVAEETGLINPIGEWVLRNACQQLKKWHDEGLTGLTMGVNLSIKQFFNPSFVSTVETILMETGVDPSLLDLEITESMTMNVDQAKERLNELKKLGVTISIDDFGTGYSSFNYLKHFPIDFIKIDKTFVNDIAHNIQSENIVNVFFMLAKTIGFQIVAEGVETKEQLEVLEKLQCNIVQGYFFSKPLPKDEFENYYLGACHHPKFIGN